MSTITASLPQAYRLDGRRILITGAAGGIRAATARVCCALGAEALLTDLNSCAPLVEELATGGYSASAREIDISLPDAADQLPAWAGDGDGPAAAGGIYRPGAWDRPGV